MWGSQFFYGSVKVSADLLSVLYIPVSDQSGDYRINSKLFPNCRKIRPFCGNNPSFHVVSSSMLCRFLPSKRHNNNIVTIIPSGCKFFVTHKKTPHKKKRSAGKLSFPIRNVSVIWQFYSDFSSSLCCFAASCAARRSATLLRFFFFGCCGAAGCPDGCFAFFSEEV